MPTLSRRLVRAALRLWHCTSAWKHLSASFVRVCAMIHAGVGVGGLPTTEAREERQVHARVSFHFEGQVRTVKLSTAIQSPRPSQWLRLAYEAWGGVFGRSFRLLFSAPDGATLDVGTPQGCSAVWREAKVRGKGAKRAGSIR